MTRDPGTEKDSKEKLMESRYNIDEEFTVLLTNGARLTGYPLGGDSNYIILHIMFRLKKNIYLK